MNEEELIIRMVNLGFDEAIASVEALTGSVEALTERMDAAALAAGGGSKGKRGLFGSFTSLKALIAGWGIMKAVTSFAAFQQQMTQLKTQTGATGAEVRKATKGILGMAFSVGTGPQSLAQAMYHLESANIRGKNALNALRIAAEGAKIGNADLTDTTTSLTAVLVAGFAKGKNAVQQMRSAMGQLNATVGAGDMTWTDLNDALGTGILGTFQVIGLKVKDLGAALAVLGDNNIRGASAATRLRMGLMQLIHPSSTVAAAMNSIHLGTFQLAEDLRKPNGLLVMLRDLKDHLGPLTTNAEKTRAADILGGIFGGGKNSAAMLLLIKQIDRLQSKYAEMHKGGKNFNKDWIDATKNLQFLIDQLKVLWQVALIKVGAGLSVVAGYLEKFITGLRQGKSWAIAIAGGILGFAAAMAALKIQTELAKIEFVSMEDIPLVALFTAVGVAILLLITHFKTVKKVVREVAKDVWHWLVGAFHAIEHVLESVWKLVRKVFNFIIGKGGTISKIFSYLNPVGFAGHLFGAGKSIVSSILGAFASGTDYVPASGSYLVGERGPEIVNLPRGSQVIPNNEMGATENGEYVLEATIVNTLDGKPVSRSVVRQSLMARARRGGGAPTLALAGG